MQKPRRRSHARQRLAQPRANSSCKTTVKLNMKVESPKLPQPWYFYNLKQSIDDPYKSFSEATLGSISGKFINPNQSSSATEHISQEELTKLQNKNAEQTTDVPLYSQTTLRRTISPVTQWIPFNPGDARRIYEEAKRDPNMPVAVGHERMMFEVFNEQVLKPIYWSIPYSTRVAKCHWVFSTTLTPIDPVWDESLLPLFQNFLANLDTYTEVLQNSMNDAEHMKLIVQRVKLMQNGKELILDVLFSPCNQRVYMFKADSSYVCAKSTANSLLNGYIPRGVLCILEPFSFADYKRMYGLPNRISDDPNYDPLPINNLILVFHGVGQKLSDQYSRINFVYAIDKLRVEVQHATESADVHQHFPKGEPSSVRTLVLAVNWRSVFNSNAKVDVSSIIVPSLGPLRQVFSDAMLDIPLYMSENRRPDMLAAAASEANRLYSLVLAHHPTFADHGRTHIIGHSLGSLITADLLTHQPTVLDSCNIHSAPFKFQTTNYFTTGSMLGVFMMLKGEHLRPRKAFDEMNGGTTTSKSDISRPFGCFAVRNLYNIINQNDLLSFLVNATVEGAQNEAAQNWVGKNGNPLEADELPSIPVAPYTGLFSSASSTSLKSMSTDTTDTTKHNEEPAKSDLSPEVVRKDVTSSPTSIIYNGDEPSSPKLRDSKISPKPSSSHSRSSSLSRFLSAPFFKYQKEDSDYEIVDKPKKEAVVPSELPEELKALQSKFRLLNENGQLDWVIPQTIGYIPSQYLKMFTAHFDYWSNKELARFLAIECGREAGEDNTLPEHRAKWTYRS